MKVTRLDTRNIETQEFSELSPNVKHARFTKMDFVTAKSADVYHVFLLQREGHVNAYKTLEKKRIIRESF